MANETITYSSGNQGWTSFWSYLPDFMVGINSTFLTMKDGSLYEHNSNATRNDFYGAQYESSVTTVFNQGNTEVKMFKTLELDGNLPWMATTTTDLDNGTIDSSYFDEKEGSWFAYIRRPDDGSYDARAISTQGIGETSFGSSFPVPNTIDFAFNIQSSVAVGDKVYRINNGSLELLGTVLVHSQRSITMNNLSGVSAVMGDMIVIAKNSQAESFGARGYYMEVKLDVTSSSEAELFAVTSQIFKSYP